jgi:hypothetical protein
MTARLKILPDPVAQILGLADVNDFSAVIFMDINAGVGGQGFEFFGDSHASIIT